MILMTIMIWSALTGQPEDPYAFLDTDYASLAAQANQAYMEQDYQMAIESYLLYLQGNAQDGPALYNTACCYGLLGDEDNATAFMLRSVRAGFDDIGWIMWDPDFDSVRDGELFSSTVDSLAQAVEEREEKLGDVIYVSGSTMIPCRIRLPEDFDPDSPCDLLIGLHGYGSSPGNFMGLWERFDSPDFIYAVPQAPYPRFAGSNPGFSWMIWSDDQEVPTASVEGSHRYICDVTDTLQEMFDVNRTYLMGFSQGCGFTFETGLLNPDLYDGLICFAGWLDTSIVAVDDIQQAADLRIFIAHGTEDEVVEYEASTTAYDYLTSLGMDVEFHDFPSGHTVDGETLRTAQLWMKDGQ